ncbi:MAG TPA: hypothetical protein PLP64_02720 [Pseudothermotoga sp.]|nr:hypothetical protein [Pseudothermotoga sp.]HOK83119.1 hypothetical protein [Pseudothermotoga sp.]HPP69710.1 hypothetical protein [Pseudothermotoga sp.]
MKCDVCGSSDAKVYKFISDGMIKEVAFCDRCLKNQLKEAVGLSKEGLKYLAGHVELVQDTDLGEISLDGFSTHELVFSVAPVAVLKILFGKSEISQEDLHEAAKRRIYILQYRLEKAIKHEDYRTANKIKKQINEIREHILEK